MLIHFLCPHAGFSTPALLTLWSEEFFVVGDCEPPVQWRHSAVLRLSALKTLMCFQALSPARGGVGVGQSHSQPKTTVFKYAKSLTGA